MDHKPPRTNDDHLRFVWNCQHVSQLCSYSANIKAGFLATGIFPYNRNVFPDEKFLSSYVTDRPAPATGTAASNYSNGNIKHDESAKPGPSRIPSPEPGPSRRRPAEADSSSSTSLSFELVRPFPKAADRKGRANATRK
jgi:hypothetical protein